MRDTVLVSPSKGSLMINLTPVAQDNDPTDPFMWDPIAPPRMVPVGLGGMCPKWNNYLELLGS